MTQIWRVSSRFTARYFSSEKMAMDRTYSHVITLLNTLQSNFSVISAIRESGGKLNEVAISEMKEYLHKIGHDVW